MRILSMTATFGALEDRTLRLEPGLNVITAPNEWGKSTWCAFLLAMLYGVDTRQRARQGQLPDKERYRPWSGKPMEGSMEVEWQGRRVTIQRRTTGRIPMGDFRAFETESGLPVPELTAENCGQVLLGVERSVYQRSGFLRGGDLAVSQDEALSRRLNQLVTTGDDSPAGPALAKGLKDLRNQCQYNKSGLLPQAREELAQCRSQLEALGELEDQASGLRERLGDLERRKENLERHLAVLQRRQDREKLSRVTEAREAAAQADRALQEAQARCRSMPSREETERLSDRWNQIRDSLRALELEAAMEPEAPEPPQAPPALRGLDAGQARERVAADLKLLEAPAEEAGGSGPMALLAAGAILMLLGLGGALLAPGVWRFLGAACLTVGGGAVLGFWLLRRGRGRSRARAEALRERILLGYDGAEPEALPGLVRAYEASLQAYGEALARWQSRQKQLEDRKRELGGELSALVGSRSPEDFRAWLEESRAAWESLGDARRAAVRASGHLEAMEAVTDGLTGDLPEPQDTLTLPQAESRTALSRVQEEIAWTRSRLDQCRGRVSDREGRERLEARAEALADRVAQLETWYAALNYGLAALTQAQRTLQSRFAPQITAQARELLSGLTGGRYDRLVLEEDLSLSAGAAGEGTVRPLAWRSDGTGDQMYLALRLAVSRALLGDAPLVLDDALTRFDDQRLAAALELLAREGERRQILLFSCQGREQAWKNRT